MRNSTKLLPIALLMLAAFPAAAQEAPRVLFCMGQCFGVDDKGVRVPVTKGTSLAPGQRIETGPDSYAQVKLGRDTAFGIGERARVRFDRRDAARDVVILDEGRIRMVGGEAIGRPATRPVELHTTEGNFVLRSADIEVKMLPRTGDASPTTTLVKLNLGDARLGDLAMTKEGVQGISGGKVLERAIPIGDIAFTPRQTLPTKTGEATTPAVRESYVAIPVANLKMTEFKPLAEPVKISTAIVSPELAKSSLYMETTALNKTEVATILVKDPTQVFQPKVAPVDSAMLLKSVPFEDKSGGTTSINLISKELQQVQKTGATTPSSTTQLVTSKVATTSPTTTTQFTPKVTTTIKSPFAIR